MYILHKCLTNSSEFFKVAFSGDWQEAANGTIDIQGFEPKTFDHYAEWLYTGRISLGACADPAFNSPDDGTLDDHYTMLMDLYVMGYFLLDRAFRNSIIDTLLATGDKFYTRPDEGCVDMIWSKVPQDAPLKKAIVNYSVFRADAAVSLKISFLSVDAM